VKFFKPENFKGENRFLPYFLVTKFHIRLGTDTVTVKIFAVSFKNFILSKILRKL